MKTCTKCGEEKALDLFVKDKQARDGRTARCKECFNADMRANHARRMADPDKRLVAQAKIRAYAQANPEAGRERTARWRATNPERARESSSANSKRFRENNPDYHKQWYQENVESQRARSREVMRQLRRERPELGRETRRRYRERNADAIRKREREKTESRRAKMPYSPELAEFMAWLVTQPCAYCGTTDNITIDHIVPLSRGGKHKAENLAPACLSCNCSKCNRLLSEWSGRR